MPLRGKLTLGFTLTDSGRVSVDLGQYTRALTFLKEALQIHSEGNNSLQQLTLCYMGWAYTNLSQYSEASEFFQRALAVSSNVNRAETLNYRGLLYMRTGAYSKARQSFEQALVSPAPGDNPGLQGIYLNNLGLSHVKLNENSQALKSYQKALTLFQELDEQIGVREVLQNIAALLEQQKQSELAIVFYKKAVNLTEEIRQNLKKLSVSEQRTYTETVAKTYRSLANLLLSQDRILEAQQVLDLLKVQELDDYLRNVRSSAQTIRGIDNLLPEQAILDKYGELQKSAVQIGKELTDLRKISEAQRTSAQQQRIAQLVKIQADSDQQFNQFIDSKDVQALVDQLSRTARKQSLDLESLSALKDDLRKAGNAVLLYPLILDDRLELILTTPDSPPIRRTVAVKREELNRTIVEFRSALKILAATRKFRLKNSTTG